MMNDLQLLRVVKFVSRIIIFILYGLFYVGMHARKKVDLAERDFTKQAFRNVPKIYLIIG